MLPISGGIFAGNFKHSISQLTAEALASGLQKLTEQEASNLSSRSMDMCILSRTDFDAFTAAFQLQAARLEGLAASNSSVPGNEEKRLRSDFSHLNHPLAEYSLSVGDHGSSASATPRGTLVASAACSDMAK